MKRKTKRRVGILLVVAMLAVLIYPALSSLAEGETEYQIVGGTITGYTGLGGDIVIPDSVDGQTVQGIGDGAFSGNLSLTSVTIPETVNSIGANAFSGCTNLYQAVVPASVMSMGDGVFYGCSSLSNLVFSANVTSIPTNAFYGCTSLSSFTMPASVTTVGDGAFGNCTLLNSINIPAAVSTISATAFTGCSNLSSITVDGGNATYSSYDGCIYNKTQTTLLYCPEGKASIEISTQATSLGGASLSGCYGITEVTIPSNVVEVGSNVFSNSGVQKVTIPKSVESISAQSSWTPELISTYSGSAGETFAINNNYNYELLDAATTDPDETSGNDNPVTPPEDTAEDPDPGTPGDGGGDGGTGDGTTPQNGNGGSGTTTTSGTVSGSSLTSNGVRSASQLAASQHVLDSTPKTGPELNAKVILCLAVFFVGVYLIVSSRKGEEEKEKMA